ncbi:hypothetical protein [Nonomuraea rhodomycinica]|uniref:Uncharacterized protein n=1 Tax=Nonomuraea rhodomycinica TaxID=1712872 RepID=A0A7Y6IUT3_9ACTN|nr:hypothetical protein [Nonomuraea rhodomycinica]NUW44473.1 hypothetical protein [Nonomuraea rhodomycinica]
MSRDFDVDRRLEPVPAETNSAGGRANHTTLLIALGAVPLLFANWFIVAGILGHDCASSYEGGNITECAGGLSEEEMSAASGLIALVLLVIQVRLIVLVRRRLEGDQECAGDTRRLYGS